MSPPRHKLLARQVRRHLGGATDAEADRLGPFLGAVDAAYHQSDADRALLERSLELTSQELLAQNERLRTELAERAAIAERLEQELGQRRAAEESLRRSLGRLDQAQRVADFGSWEIAVADGGAVYWSDQMYRIFGHAVGAVTPSFGLFTEAVSAEAVADILEVVRQADDAAVRGVTFQITRPDGEARTLRASGEVVRGEGGRLTHIYGVCADITEDEERRAELVRAKERAEELLRVKTALLSNMSHELRTPLAGILGYAQLLVAEAEGDQQMFAEAIAAGGLRLMDTLNSVLDLAQLESGTFGLHPAPVDVRAEAEEAIALLQPLAAEKPIRLALADGGQEVWALADRSAVYRVLNNLIGNAVKFTEAGHVEVSVEVVAADAELPQVRLRVADTGPGIGPAFLPHLFDEFRQESDGAERRHEGNGLGLTITKRLVTLMGGTIDVASTVGAGTVFDVLFPVASPPPAPEAAPVPAALPAFEAVPAVAAEPAFAADPDPTTARWA